MTSNLSLGKALARRTYRRQKRRTASTTADVGDATKYEVKMKRRERKKNVIDKCHRTQCEGNPFDIIIIGLLKSLTIYKHILQQIYICTHVKKKGQFGGTSSYMEREKGEVEEERNHWLR